MKAKWLTIDLLKLDPKNPRAHSRKQIGQIANSIKVFGFNVPVLVDADANVTAGHGRILAAQLLGWREVPTICLDHLTGSQAKAFAIADNRLSENSAWDDRLLAEQLRELSMLDLDFSLEDLSFDMGEIDFRIETLKTLPATGDDSADILPAESSGPPVSEVGDLWLLGPHRLYCGSALKDGSYNTLMQGESAAMVITDPPFNLSIEKTSVVQDRFIIGSF